MADTSKKTLCAPPIFSRTRRDDFFGERNDVKVADQGSLSMSVPVSYVIESEANTEK